MYFIFYWILFILILLLSYVIYNIYMNIMFQTNNFKIESFENENNNNQPVYDLTVDSSELDSKFDIFEDSKKYIKGLFK